MNDTLPPPTPIRPRDTSGDIEYQPIVSFEDREDACPACEDKEYVIGFEAGLLYARLEAKPLEFGGAYHSANRVVLERIADARGYDAAFVPSGTEGWLFGTFTRRPPVRRLRVVQKDEG